MPNYDVFLRLNGEDSAGPGPQSPAHNSFAERLRRFHHDFPEWEIWQIEEVHGNNVYDIKLGHERDEYVKAITSDPTDFGVEDWVIVGYYHGDRSRKFILAAGTRPVSEEEQVQIVDGWLSYLSAQNRLSQSLNSVYPAGAKYILTSPYSGGSLTRVVNGQIFVVSSTGYALGFIDTVVRVNPAGSGSIEKSYTRGGGILDLVGDPRGGDLYIVEWEGPRSPKNTSNLFAQRVYAPTFTQDGDEVLADTRCRLTRLNPDLEVVWSTPWRNDVIYRQSPAIILGENNISVYGIKVGAEEVEEEEYSKRVWLHVTVFSKDGIQTFSGRVPYPDPKEFYFSDPPLPGGTPGQEILPLEPVFYRDTASLRVLNPEILYPSSRLSISYGSGTDSGHVESMLRGNRFSVQDSYIPKNSNDELTPNNTCQLINILEWNGIHVPAFHRTTVVRAFRPGSPNLSGSSKFNVLWTRDGSKLGSGNFPYQEGYTPLTITKDGVLVVLVEKIEYQVFLIRGVNVVGLVDDDVMTIEQLDKVLTVANQAERYALTAGEIDAGEYTLVEQSDTGAAYTVADDTKLNSEEGWTLFSTRYTLAYGRTLHLQTMNMETGQVILRKEIGQRIETQVYVPYGNPTANGLEFIGDWYEVDGDTNPFPIQSPGYDDRIAGGVPLGEYEHDNTLSPGDYYLSSLIDRPWVNVPFKFFRRYFDGEGQPFYSEFGTTQNIGQSGNDLWDNGSFIGFNGYVNTTELDDVDEDGEISVGDFRRRIYTYAWCQWNTVLLEQYTTAPLNFNPLSFCVSEDGKQITFGPFWAPWWKAEDYPFAENEDNRVRIPYAIRDYENNESEPIFLSEWVGGDDLKLDHSTWHVAFSLETLEKVRQWQRVFASPPDVFTAANPLTMSSGQILSHVREELEIASVPTERGRLRILYPTGGASGEGNLGSVKCTPFATWDHFGESGAHVRLEDCNVEYIVASDIGIITKDRNFLLFLPAPAPAE